MRGLASALLAAFLVFPACLSGETGPPSAPTTAAASYCSAETRWKERCSQEICPGSGSVCPAGSTCPSMPDPPCDVANLFCETYGEPCLSRIYRPEALAAITAKLSPPPPAAVAFSKACTERKTACESQITSDAEFFCFDLSAMTDDYIAIFQTCLSKPCTTIRA
jgi:hypothetical protein